MKQHFAKNLKQAEPDFNLLVDVIKGKKTSNRVIPAELLIDEEVRQVILEDYFETDYFPPPVSHWGTDSESASDLREKRLQYEKYFENAIGFWNRMGYSLFTDLTFILNFESLSTLTLKTNDTAPLSKGERHWAIESSGMIGSWEDFERFPWDKTDSLIREYGDYLAIIEKFLPDGMKAGIVATLFEEPLEWIFGYEGFFYLMHDQPDLVKAVFEKVGDIMLDFYTTYISHASVGCIFHADDLGFKTGSLISPHDLDLLVFPWFKKYVETAHAEGKPFFLHSCGYRNQIMDTLIDDVGIDAIHSFEDASYPVEESKKIWGERVGIIGGVDIDKLSRLQETELRKYVRKVLETCMQGGRYIYGSGNSITNYVPVENYLILMEEGIRWQP